MGTAEKLNISINKSSFKDALLKIPSVRSIVDLGSFLPIQLIEDKAEPFEHLQSNSKLNESQKIQDLETNRIKNVKHFFLNYVEDIKRSSFASLSHTTNTSSLTSGWAITSNFCSVIFATIYFSKFWSDDTFQEQIFRGML